ncbi:MAG TPA: SufD family Fe-S cluster assembly protein [Rhizomicrobium sp.]|jgi:Fe-S cluster assembly protein SufD|nr:SufD family Fe-S cluster assembly protein [Rhizomicrobium sp.]
MSALVLPNRRVEDWKYSDVANVIDAASVAAAPAAKWSIASVSGATEIGDLPAITPRGPHGAMAEFALASANSGPYVRVPKGRCGELRLDLVSGGYGRAVIVIEEGGQLVLHEKVTAEDLANIAVDIVVGRGARLTHVRHAATNDAAQFVDYAVRLVEGSGYRSHFANFGGRLSRVELHVLLEGEGAEANLSGVGALDGAHADLTTHVTHAVGPTRSTQLVKYVAGGRARGVYQGKVTVAPGANGSDSSQTAKGLLLGDRAEIDLKPELEILADDVKCAHGAAVGDLDMDSLFYLRTRGVPESEARAILMRAFLADAVDDIVDEALRAEVWRAVDAALEKLS